jgi:hypothetical protein
MLAELALYFWESIEPLGYLQGPFSIVLLESF